MVKDSASFFVKFCCLLIAFFCISLASAEIRINEVELNPAGSSDNGHEWIELYSDKQVDIENWKIENGKGKNMTFNASFSGYYVLVGSYQFLTDDNNTLKLRDNEGNLVFSTTALTDKKNNNNSWQYCNEEWIFAEATRSSENYCGEEPDEEDGDNEPANETAGEEDDEKQEQENNQTVENNSEDNARSSEDTNKNPETIILGETEDIKSDNNVLYKSKTSKIKEYSLWAFSVVCVIIIILLLIDRNKNRGIE